MLDRLKSSCVTAKKPMVERHVVHQRGDGADAELPFEAEPDVEQHADHGGDDRQRPVPGKLPGNTRTDNLDTPVVVFVGAEGALRLLHGLLLRRVAARLRRDADQHLVGRAESLHLDIAETEPAQRRAYLAKIRLGSLALHLDQGAALEIDAKIQAGNEGQRNGTDHEEDGDDEPDPRHPHEGDARVVRYDAYRHGRLPIRAARLWAACGVPRSPR